MGLLLVILFVVMFGRKRTYGEFLSETNYTYTPFITANPLKRQRFAQYKDLVQNSSSISLNNPTENLGFCSKLHYEILFDEPQKGVRLDHIFFELFKRNQTLGINQLNKILKNNLVINSGTKLYVKFSKPPFTNSNLSVIESCQPFTVIKDKTIHFGNTVWFKVCRKWRLSILRFYQKKVFLCFQPTRRRLVGQTVEIYHKESNCFRLYICKSWKSPTKYQLVDLLTGRNVTKSISMDILRDRKQMRVIDYRETDFQLITLKSIIQSYYNCVPLREELQNSYDHYSNEPCQKPMIVSVVCIC